jgi:hypothetical protein
MIHILLLCTLVSSVEDSLITREAARTKSRSKQIIFNTVLGFGFTFGAGFFHTKGNSAYEEYQESQTVSAALENWRRVQLYDTIRNVCAAGAVIFLARAVYYQFLHTREPASQFQPVLDIRYTYHPKIIIGISKNL